jgi:DNA-binding NtrC family response regulator
MAAIYRDIAALADVKGPVFIHGRPGTGKGVLCRLLRESGGYAAKTVQEINCAALDPVLQTGALFGVPAGEEGFFLAEPGKAVLAGEGLLIVEEVGEMDRGLQERLAKAIEACRCGSLTGGAPETVKARLIATSSTPWNTLLAEGKLSPRLARLFDGRAVNLPALSERPRDIPLLVDFFIAALCASGTAKKISPEVYHFLCRRPWEGNVRELKNFITRLFYLSGPGVITARDLDGAESPASRLQPMAGTADVATLSPMSLYELEKKYILHMIAVNEGNKSRTARTLQISLKTLRNKLKEYAMITG